MAVEKRRGCGYRKIGGIYLVSEPGGMPCDRLPLILDVCPVCSHGFKQSRGWTWVDVNGLVGGVHRDCTDTFPCPLCMATSEMGRAGLLWIGEKFYKTPAEFDSEAAELGVSRRIKSIPRGFKVGETWVLLAHPKTTKKPCEPCESTGFVKEPESTEPSSLLGETCKDCDGKGYTYAPAIFKVWRPSRIEKLLPESLRGSEEQAELEKRGISCVFIPDGDRDHMGTVYDQEREEETAEAA